MVTNVKKLSKKIDSKKALKIFNVTVSAIAVVAAVVVIIKIKGGAN